MNEIDRYLNEVSWAMGGSFAEQQAVRDELRAHIGDAARDLRLQGVAPADALEQALGELGEPSEVGRAMRPSLGTQPLRRPLAQLEGALVLARHNARHLPPMQLVMASAAVAALAAFVALAYAWPG